MCCAHASPLSTHSRSCSICSLSVVGSGLRHWWHRFFKSSGIVLFITLFWHPRWHVLPQQRKRINLLTSTGNSSKQMQQTSGSSFLNRTVGDESAVNEVTVDEVPVVLGVSFLLMVCVNCVRSICLAWTVVLLHGGGEAEVIGRSRVWCLFWKKGLEGAHGLRPESRSNTHATHTLHSFTLTQEHTRFLNKIHKYVVHWVVYFLFKRNYYL